jgi:hypothetical protein
MSSFVVRGAAEVDAMLGAAERPRRCRWLVGTREWGGVAAVVGLGALPEFRSGLVCGAAERVFFFFASEYVYFLVFLT